jgi:hypothetical protein
MSRTLIFALLAAALVGFFAAVAGAQAPREARSKADCAAFQPPLRGHCLECVSRPRPHRFVADNPPATRCTPID